MVINLDELTPRIYAAIEGMEGEESLRLLGELAGKAPAYYKRHLEMEHSLPSPSSVQTCRLQQWFKGKEYMPTRTIPAAWSARSAAGVLTEIYWVTILRLAGVDVILPEDNGDPLAHVDGFIGDDGILELKNKTGWGYKRLIEGKGIAYEEPREYMQVQLYLNATGRDWVLYFASPADPALLQSLMRQWKKYGTAYDLPLFYLEVVEKRQQDIDAGLARMDMIAIDLASDSPPPREFDAVEFGKKGAKAFPCGYCVHIDSCNEVYGSDEKD